MNEVFAGIVRHALTIGGGYLVAKGKLTPDDVNTLVGVGTALAGLGWSVYAKRK